MLKYQMGKFRNKYNARPSVIDGKHFASGLEASVYRYLLLSEKNGFLKDLKCQQAVELTDAKIRCKIDFSYFCLKRNALVYAEAKGVETERWLIIKKLYAYYGPAPLEIYKSFGGNRIGMAETIIPSSLPTLS